MSLVCFDYDDTIFPSTYLSKNGYSLNDNMVRINEVEEQLEKFESIAYELLSTALSYSGVAIVSNSQTGWIQQSAEKFIPKLLPLLNKCTIISARSTYENLYPGNQIKWKFHAFQDLLKNNGGTYNIISFGDSFIERAAILAVTRDLPNTKTKSVKFVENPTANQLCQQQELITNCYKCIYTHNNDLDLMLTLALEK